MHVDATQRQRQGAGEHHVRIMDLDKKGGGGGGGGGKQLSASQMNLSLLSNSGDNRATQHRLNIIYELLTTEEVYIKDIYFTLEVREKRFSVKLVKL